MRGKRNDLAGLRFNHLLVIEHSPRRTDGCRNSQWLCRCDCGRLLIIRHDNLLTSRTTQCSECRGAGGRKSIFVKDVIEIDD